MISSSGMDVVLQCVSDYRNRIKSLTDLRKDELANTIRAFLY